MHQLLSFAGLWPTLVSVLALFVHPLLFHLFSLPLLLLLHLLPVDSFSIHVFLRWDSVCYTLLTFSSCHPVSFLFISQSLLPFWVCLLSFTSSDYSVAIPELPPLFASSQHVSTCLLSSLVSSSSSRRNIFRFNALCCAWIIDPVN